MRRARELDARLRSLRMLGQAVVAMKSLSAHHFRATRAALEPARAYRSGLNRVLQSTGASLPAGRGAKGIVVIGGELGFCGAYNTQVAAAGAELRAAHGAGPTYCIGRRAASYLRRLGVPLDRQYTAPTSMRGITDTLLTVAQDIITDYIAQDLSSFEVVANRFEGVGVFHARSVGLLPVESRFLPTAPAVRYASRQHVESVGVRELLYITMVEVLLDALASEHGARLLATKGAERWLNDRIDRLQRHLMAVRRETSTQEVIEIAANARVRHPEP